MQENVKVEMTREQVIKAIKCQINPPATREGCDTCPLSEIISLSKRRKIIFEEALKLIEGTTSKTKEACACDGCFHNCTNFCDNIKNCHKKEFMEPDKITDARLAEEISCLESEDERFPVETLNIETAFGKVSIEYPVGDNDDDKIRFFDSNGKYIDYIEAETMREKAEKFGVSFVDAIISYAEEIKNAKTIDELCHLVCDCWEVAVYHESWKSIAHHLGVTTEDDVKNNELVNTIGDFYILISEC